MYYIDAIHLMKACVENGILKTNETKDMIFIVRETGRYIEQADIVARELMHDEDGQRILIEALKEKGIEFIPLYPVV